MPTNLNPALESGDFYWQWNCVEVEHHGRAYTTGAIDITYGGQTIVPAGSLPHPPAAPVSVELWPYNVGGVPGASANDLYHGYATTVYPDGSWSFDDPVDIPSWLNPGNGFTYGASVSLLLVASWDLAPVDDSPTGWAAIPPNGGEFTGSPEGSRHDTMVHLRGDLTAIVDFPTWIANNIPHDLQAWSPDGYGTMTMAQASWGPLGLYQEGTRWRDMGVVTPSDIGFSRQESLYGGSEQARIAGGTKYYQQSYKLVNSVVDESASGSITCTYPADYPFIGTFDESYPSGLISVSTQSVDLSAAMASISETPDWVAIYFTAQGNTRYESYDACPVDRFSLPTDGYGHTIRVWPSINGEANPKFLASSGTNRISSSAGPQATSASLEDWGPSTAWLAPNASEYTRPGLTELFGNDHMQLLWRPEDVDTVEIDILGTFRTVHVNFTLTIVPLYETGDMYLKPGDVVTLDRGYAAAYPGPLAGPIIMFV